MMAVVYILGALQVLSTFVNLLALGAFWVTPGLRTTANKFVINLLFVNLIGCLAVTPALWLGGSSRFEPLSLTDHHAILSTNNMPIINRNATIELFDGVGPSDDRVQATAFTTANKSTVHESTVPAVYELPQQREKQHLEQSGADATIASAKNDCVHNRDAGAVAAGDKLNCDDTISEENGNNIIYPDDTAKNSISHVIESDKLAVDMHDGEETLAIFGTKTKRTRNGANERQESGSYWMQYWQNLATADCQHFWGLDLAAALGGISVLLVVGDTWCAVTDPLRYHARISPVKSWLLIGSNWFIGIIFGIGSIFRHDACQQRPQQWSHELPASSPSTHIVDVRYEGGATKALAKSILNVHYDMLYISSFFIIVVLFPLCVVCIMYWNIFWEARQSGQRMRQNGSSPLLQSALNLATAPPQLPALNSLPIQPNEMNNQVGKPLMSIHAKGGSNRRRHTVDATHIQINVSEFKNLHQQPSTDADDSDVESNQSQYLQIPTNMTPQQSHHQHLSTLQWTVLHEDEIDAQHQMKLCNKKHDRHCGQYATHLTIEECSELLPKVHGNNHKSITIATNQPNEFRYVQSSPNLEELNEMNDSDSIQIDSHCMRNKHKHITSSCHSSIHEISSSGSTSTRASSTSSASSSSSTAHSGAVSTTKALSYMSSLRHRLSNASSIFKYREESRAARISILVIIIFLVSYFPYGLLGLLHLRIDSMPMPQLTTIEISFLLIANIGFPIIFAHRNKRVRRGVCRIFGIDTRKNTRLQVRHPHNNNMHNHTQNNNIINNQLSNHQKSGDVDDGTRLSFPIDECEKNIINECHAPNTNVDAFKNIMPPKNH